MMDPISSAIPIQAGVNLAARLYGVRPVSPVPGVHSVQRGLQAGSGTEPLARIGQDVGVSKPDSDPSRLVAARVDPIDLARDVAQIAGRPTDGALPMYRHPADRNQAATAVALGRALDIKG
jgi:hypothetical protein